MWHNQSRRKFGNLAAISKGSGPRLLLLHGVGLRAEAWAAQIDEFANSYHVIAPDMPGHGASPLQPGLTSLADYASQLAVFMDEPLFIVGHSMGAMLALHLAATMPAKVKAVAALNAVFERSAEASAAVQLRAMALDGQAVPDPGPTLDRWFGDGFAAECAACHAWLSSIDPVGYQRAYRVFAGVRGSEPKQIAELTMPALFMTGTHDPNSTPAMADAMAALAPQGEVTIIGNAAHMMTMTHAMQVNQALHAFLKLAGR